MLSHSSGVREGRIRVLADSVAGVGPYFINGTFSLCLQMAEEAGKLLWASFVSLLKLPSYLRPHFTHDVMVFYHIENGGEGMGGRWNAGVQTAEPACSDDKTAAEETRPGHCMSARF